MTWFNRLFGRASQKERPGKAILPFTAENLKGMREATLSMAFLSCNSRTISNLLDRLEAAEDIVKRGGHTFDCIEDVGKICSCGYAAAVGKWKQTKGK